MKSLNKFSIILILAIGAFLRFYNLGWGLPYPFHPDERNMAEAITRLSPTNLDPQFYAYGQFPLYLAYFTGKIFLSLIKKGAVETLSFTQAILALRFWSAVFSTATIYVAYLISKKILSSKKLLTFDFSLLTAIATAFTPGLIQAAHFGTTESILACCFLAVVYFSLKILESPIFSNFFWASFFLGIALGSKISAAIFVTPLLLGSLFQISKQKNIKEVLKIFLFLTISLSLTLSLTLLTSPYLFLKYKESRGTLLYEISVAEGKSVPFYTRQFIETTPVLFQLQKIFPYALGWPIFILGTFGFLIMIISLIRKKRNQKLTSYFLLLTSYLIYFLSQAFLFAKWTRFMIPIFPFFSIFASYCLSQILSFKKFPIIHSLLFIVLFTVPGLLFSSIYFRPDIRFQASEWIYKNIPPNSHVLSETANVVDIPILPQNYKKLSTNTQYLTPNTYHLSPISFNFYDLDENPEVFQKLLDELVKSDYIFIPSRRIFMNHLRLPEKYPLIAKYYQLLFSGELGFNKVAEFKILNDEPSEESWSVFDHPVIRIYKKVINYNKSDYEKFFED